MAFVPGELELCEEDGVFVLTVKKAEVLRTRSRKSALSRFNSIRKSMEQEFPGQVATNEEKKALLHSVLTDAAVDETLRRPPKKRSTARGSRTFGG